MQRSTPTRAGAGGGPVPAPVPTPPLVPHPPPGPGPLPDPPPGPRPRPSPLHFSAPAAAGGFTLVELLVVVAVASVLLALGLPRLRSVSERLRVSMAAHEVAGVFQKTRLLAVRENTHVGVRFTEEDGELRWALYTDGDGDGVRTRDIRSGVDPRRDIPMPLRRFGRSVRPGFPDGPMPRDPSHRSRRLGRRHDPLRFGRSDIVSFGPLGTATSGSIYLSEAGGRWTAAVRLFGRTGKVKVIVYDPRTELWD